MALKVAFTNFWPGFDPRSNFFLYVISLATSKSIEIVGQEEADVVITPCSPDKKVPNVSKAHSRQKNWFYTGENLRPNFESYDAVFSFDLTLRKNAFRLPLWWLYLDFSLSKTSPNLSDFQINPNKLHHPREISSDFNNSISSFVGNLTELRRDAFNSIPSSMDFTGFGLSFNNQIESKLGQKGKFDFNLCFENSYFPGYHTEKLLQAWSMESVPLYFGAKTVSLDFNSKAFINLAEFPNLQEFWIYIKSLSRRQKSQIINAPLLEKPLDISPLVSFIESNL